MSAHRRDPEHGTPARAEDLFRDPPQAGAPEPGGGYARGRAGSLRSGVLIDLWLRIADGVVTDARFEAFGGPAAIAAAAWTAKRAVGRTVESLHGLRGLEIAAELDLAAEEAGAALVVEDALREALSAQR